MAVKRKRLAQRRKALGYTQESLAERLRVDRTTVVRWERGECEPQPWFRRRLANALDVSLDQLDDLLCHAIVPGALDSAPSTAVTVATGIDDGGDTTDRRRFTTLAALTSIGVVGPLRDVFASAEVPRAIGMEQVQLAASLVDRFRQVDAAAGANALFDLAAGVHHRLSLWAQHSSYSRDVGEALQTTLADLSNQVGWLAIDAERRPESRQYLHEAISRARIADDPREEVRALACLSLLTRRTQPRESLQCAEAAQRSSAGWATPRLRTLLHLRAAHAYAHLRDASAFGREMAKARAHLDKGTHDDDLPFLRFVTPQEATGLEGLAYLALDRPERAVTAFRRVTHTSDATHQRNQIYYRIRLAEAAEKQGDLTGAAQMALAALPNVTTLQSRRTAQLLARLRSDLAQHRRSVPQIRAFADAYDEAVA